MNSQSKAQVDSELPKRRRPAARSRSLVAGVLVALASLLPSCLSVSEPEGFRPHPSASRSEVKAVAADESLFWYREFRDAERGALEFWKEAVVRDLVDGRGYALIDERGVRIDEDPAVELHFEVTVGGVARAYLLVIGVAQGSFANTIRVGEYVAEKGLFDRHVDAVRAALGVR